MINIYLYQRDYSSLPIELPYQDGFVLNQVFNEQLSSGVLTLPNVEFKIPLRRLDFIRIEEYDPATGDTTYNQVFCVGSFTIEYDFKNDGTKLYTYNINLVSTTILLQDKVLPNLATTQPLFAKRKRTILDQFKRITKVFAPNLVIRKRLEDLIRDEICPEFQWNRKTLFEIFNDLLSIVSATIDLRVVIADGINYDMYLDYVSFIPTTETIPTEDITDISKEATIDDYCTEIEMEASNVVAGDFNTFAMRNLTPRSQDFILTTDNCQLILDRPIYTINKVEIFIPKVISIRINLDTLVTIQPRYFDITKWVVESSVYNTKQVFDNTGYRIWRYYKHSGGVFDEKKVEDYKLSFLSYTEGSNTIDNIAYKEPTVFGSTDDFSIRNIFYYALWDYLEATNPDFKNINATSWENFDFPDPRDLLFNVSCQSLGDLRFRLKKDTKEYLNNKLVIDSQANSYVDANALLKAEQENVNRLGNETITINAIFSSMDYVPSFGTKYENYVLSQASMRVFNEKIYWQGQFTKGFVRKNLYSGIRSKARFTSIATGSEALSRKDLIIQEMLFDDTDGTDLKVFANMLLSRIGFDDNQFQIVIRTEQIKEENGVNKFVYSDYALMPTSRYALGKNIILGFKMLDNFSINTRIVSESRTNAYTQKQVSYVDENGEFETLYIYFTRINPYVPTTPEGIEQWIKWSRMYPIIDSNRFQSIKEKDELSFLVKKDNREIYSADIQLNFKSNNDNIIVYDRFISQMSIILGKNKFPNNVQYFFNNDGVVYDENDTKVKGHPDFGEYEITDNMIVVPRNALESWGLCDYDGNLFIVNNKNTNIYLKGGKKKLC